MNDLLKFDKIKSPNIKLAIVIGEGTGTINFNEQNGDLKNRMDLITLGSIKTEDCLEYIKYRLLENRYLLLYIIGSAAETEEIQLVQKIGALAHEMLIIVIGVFTVPYCETYGNRKQTMENLIDLKKKIKLLLVISIEHLLCSGEPIVANSFQKTCTQVFLTLKTFNDVLERGAFNINYSAINSFCSGYGILSTAIFSGKNRGTVALNTILTHSTTIETLKSAKKILLLISSGNIEVTMNELVLIMEGLMNNVNNNIEILWNRVFDENLGDNVRLALVAAGLEISSIDYYLNQRNQYCYQSGF